MRFDLQVNGQMKEEIKRIVARKLVDEEIIECYNSRQYTATNRIGEIKD